MVAFDHLPTPLADNCNGSLEWRRTFFNKFFKSIAEQNIQPAERRALYIFLTTKLSEYFHGGI